MQKIPVSQDYLDNGSGFFSLFALVLSIAHIKKDRDELKEWIPESNGELTIW